MCLTKSHYYNSVRNGRKVGRAYSSTMLLKRQKKNDEVMKITLDKEYMTLSGDDEQKKRLEGTIVSAELSAGQLPSPYDSPNHDYPAILFSSNFSEEDARSYDSLSLAPLLQQQQHQQQHPMMNQIKLDSKKSISDELIMRSISPDNVTGCYILDHIEMGNYAYGHISIAAADEKSDDDINWQHDEGICDEGDVCDEEEQKQNMRSGYCDVSELQVFGHVLKYLQCYEL